MLRFLFRCIFERTGIAPYLPSFIYSPAPEPLGTDSSSQARSPIEHINDIARRGNYKETLGRTLQVLTDDLNPHPHHFLLELLQNADDAKYDDPHPTVTLTYTVDNHLRVHCNERGFSREDVEAICDISNSSKRASTTATGEKGIGFKSVFRVASTVWIASGGYHFKLRGSDPLKPETFQPPFPDGSSADGGGTHMFLELLETKVLDVRSAFEQFDPASILFLNRVKCINMQVHGMFEKRFLRREDLINNEVCHITIFEDGRPSLCYMQFSFSVIMKAARSRYRDSKSSHIKLAFPVIEGFEKVISREEKVHACLPVASFGFKFAINADFIVTANREGIHSDCKWNQELRDAIPAKFGEAIELLNKHNSSLSFSWPLLLNSPLQSGEFFRTTMGEILETLKTRSVLRTSTNDLIAAADSRLFRFPAEWRLGPHKMLPVPNQVVNLIYLSHLYDPECTEATGRLGVKEIQSWQLMEQCKHLAYEEGFDRQSEDWQIMLAEMLNKNHNLRFSFSHLKIIPVEGDKVSWTSSNESRQDLFIADNQDEISSLPQNIGLLSIPLDASRNEHRRSLFKEYGARSIKLSAGTIAKKIGEAHARLDPRKSNIFEWTTKDLISHTTFLFKKRSEVRSPEKLWVATTSDGPQFASTTFLRPLESEFESIKVPVLHQDYFTGLSQQDREEFMAWIIKAFKMPEVPRLVVPDGAGLTIAPEMKTIAQHCSSIMFLKLLQHHWKSHSSFLTKGNEDFQEKVWNEIVSTEVYCLDSQKHPLGKTLLPIDAFNIPQKMAPLALLPISQIREHEWQFLSEMGVKLRPDVDDWLKCLTDMKSSREIMQDEPEDLLQLASSIYSKIEDVCCNDIGNYQLQDMVRERFQRENLVLIPSQSSSDPLRKHIWARADQCIWWETQHLTLRHSFCLSKYSRYERNSYFFQTIVKIESKCSLGHLRKEASGLTNCKPKTEETWNHVVQLILRMSHEIQNQEERRNISSEEIHELRKCVMIPIRNQSSTSCYDHLVAATDAMEWFIADREILYNSLEKEVSLFALSIEMTRECAPLLSILGLERRQLSGIAVAHPTRPADGNGRYAARWMEKAQYIDRILLESSQRPTTEHARMRSLEIKTYFQDILGVQWVVQRHGRSHVGTVKNREAVASVRDTVFSIYVQTDSISSPGALMELAGDICDIFHVPDQRRLLIQYIISEDDTENIEVKLKNGRVPMLSSQELSVFPATHPSISQLKKAQDRQKGLATSENSMTKSSTELDGDLLMPFDEPKARGRVEEKEAKKQEKKNERKRRSNQELFQPVSLSQSSTQQKRGPVKRETKPAAKIEQGLEVLEQSIPNEVFRQQPRKKLERLPVSRRLQESTIEELLMQAPLPATKNTQEKPKANTLLSALQEVKNARGDSSDVETSRPSSMPDSLEGTTSARTSPRTFTKPGSESMNAQHRGILLRGEGQQLLHAMEGENPAHRKRRLIQQFSGTLEASTLFRQSAQTNTFYVLRQEELPAVHSGDGTDSEIRVLESRLCIPKHGSAERALYALVQTQSRSNDKEADFLGQIWVSQLFSNHLGLAYRHGEHWKSKFRNKMFPNIRSTPQNQSTYEVPFELHDDDACRALTNFLSQKSFTVADSWQPPPVYYIDVATTAEACNFPVEMETSRFVKAREYHVNHREECPKHVFIFVRIFNVNATDKAPTAAFYIDPWQMYTDGLIDVSPLKDKYSVSFKGDPPFFVDHVQPHTHEWKKLQNDTTIRLLRLEKGLWEDELQGTFEFLDLNNRTPQDLEYTAISYAWGSSLKQFSLRMTEPDDGSEIPLQTSLYLALRRLRQEDKAVVVWADAVCIDQSDDSEKANQILLLPKIFQSAQKVFAWIGEEDDDASKAMEFLRKLGGWVSDFSGKTIGLDDSQASMFNRPDLPQIGDAIWIAVRNLLERSWFSRIWIVQEAVLAAQLIIACGAETMMWEILHNATALCFMNGLWDPKMKCPIADERTQKNILQLGHLRAKSLRDGQFSPCDCMFNLLQLFHQKDVTKPRDRLFALLGMAQDGTEGGFRPTYEGSDEDVLVRYGSVFIEQGYGLALLYQARIDLGRNGLPSWMPDLTAAIYPKTVTAWGDRSGDLEPGKASKEFNASGDDSESRNEELDGKVLILHGWVVDEIVQMGEYASDTDDVVLFIEEIFDYINHVCCSIPDKEREEIQCRLPIGDTYQPATPSWDPEDRTGRYAHPRATRSDAYDNMVEYLRYRRNQPLKHEATAIPEAGQADSVISESGLIRRRMWSYYKTVIEFAESFQPASALVCETKRKRVGIVPTSAYSATDGKLGDKIVIFQGAKVPYVIRESDSKPGNFRAVGECYIDGIMHGELFKAGKVQLDLQLQRIRLE